MDKEIGPLFLSGQFLFPVPSGFSVHSMPRVGDRFTRGPESCHRMRTVTDAECAIQMFVHRHAAPGQGGAKSGRWNLKDMVHKLDRIVSGNQAFVLNREDSIQIQVWHRNKSRARLSRSNTKLAIELVNVVRLQEIVGVF